MRAVRRAAPLVGDEWFATSRRGSPASSPRSPTSRGVSRLLIATVIAQRHPDVATVERAVDRRGQRVYVDSLQNSRGKTLAGASSARATAGAGVSTPLGWDEVDRALDPRDFTLRTIDARLARVGDRSAALRRARPVDLDAVVRAASTRAGRRLA